MDDDDDFYDDYMLPDDVAFDYPMDDDDNDDDFDYLLHDNEIVEQELDKIPKNGPKQDALFKLLSFDFNNLFSNLAINKNLLTPANAIPTDAEADLNSAANAFCKTLVDAINKDFLQQKGHFIQACTCSKKHTIELLQDQRQAKYMCSTFGIYRNHSDGLMQIYSVDPQKSFTIQFDLKDAIVTLFENHPNCLLVHFIKLPKVSASQSAGTIEPIEKILKNEHIWIELASAVSDSAIKLLQKWCKSFKQLPKCTMEYDSYLEEMERIKDFQTYVECRITLDTKRFRTITSKFVQLLNDEFDHHERKRLEKALKGAKDENENSNACLRYLRFVRKENIHILNPHNHFTKWTCKKRNSPKYVKKKRLSIQLYHVMITKSAIAFVEPLIFEQLSPLLRHVKTEYKLSMVDMIQVTFGDLAKTALNNIIHTGLPIQHKVFKFVGFTGKRVALFCNQLPIPVTQLYSELSISSALAMKYWLSCTVKSKYKQLFVQVDETSEMTSDNCGTGYITPALVTQICKTYEYVNQKISAFAIKCAGCEGVVIPKMLTDCRLEVRPSMMKFNKRSAHLHIVDCAHYQVGYTDKSFVLVLSSAEMSVIPKLRQHFEQQVNLMATNEHVSFAKLVTSTMASNLLTQHFHKLQEANYYFNDPFLAGMRSVAIAECEKRIRNGEYMMENSASLLGIVDEYKLLCEGQVFCKCNGKEMIGQMLITQLPCFSTANICTMQAQCIPKEYASMDNVIVFSQKGPTIHCGTKRFLVCWEPLLLESKYPSSNTPCTIYEIPQNAEFDPATVFIKQWNHPSQQDILQRWIEFAKVDIQNENCKLLQHMYEKAEYLDFSDAFLPKLKQQRPRIQSKKSNRLQTLMNNRSAIVEPQWISKHAKLLQRAEQIYNRYAHDLSQIMVACQLRYECQVILLKHKQHDHVRLLIQRYRHEFEQCIKRDMQEFAKAWYTVTYCETYHPQRRYQMWSFAWIVASELLQIVVSKIK